MRVFTYQRAASPAEAAAAAARAPGARFIAGGTNLLDLMKLEIETPGHLIDVNGLGLDKIEPTPEGGLRVGALVRNTDLAADARIRRDYAVPIERYRDEAAAAAHKETTHYATWRDTVAPMMARPRVGTKYVNASPDDAAW